ncbi:DUF4360 domain-containing protein [Actinomadura rubrisoli]|nr:DUF4360 domain-containing protein [Actinomadura rubrisoli]
MIHLGRAAVGAALAVPALTASPASADPTIPPPGSVAVSLVTTNGSGCPPGTVAVANDVAAFTVSYSAYEARRGGDSLPTDFRKNCQLNLKITTPPEFTYGMNWNDHQGLAHLEPGASGVLKSSRYHSGMPQTTAWSHALGPLSGDWKFSDTIDIAQVVYKPCGEERNLNLNTELRVNLGTSDKSKVSSLRMGGPSSEYRSTYHLRWKRCPVP